MALLREWILTGLIALPLVAAVAVGLLRTVDDTDADRRRVSRAALGWSIAVLVLAIVAAVMFCQAPGEGGRRAWAWGEYALSQNLSWVGDAEGLPGTRPVSRYVDLRYHVAVDGLSIWLVVLSALLTTLSIWASFTYIRERVKEFYVLMLLLEMGMIGVFCARDLLLFYVFFEFTLVPMFLIIAIWGGAQRRFAALKFFLYTFTGSMLTFAGVLYLAYAAYSLPMGLGGVGHFTFDLDTLYGLQLSRPVQCWLFLAFTAGFAVKVPLWPLHTWLPLAHTEAPTAGSVLLAGILLKLGTYGFLRFNIPLFPDAAVKFAPLLAVLAIIGVIYAALAAWVQADMKKLVAYSSVSHLGFCILGMFSLKPAGVTGSLLHMINHGLSTGALFLLVGMIYERYHTRRFSDLGGLARRMPWLAFFLVFFAFSSVGLPGLNGFVSEFLVLLGIFTSSQSMVDTPAGPLGIVYASFATTGVVLSAIYMLAMCQRVLFGPLVEPPHTPDASRGLTADLTRREIALLVPLAALCLAIGVYPKPLIETIRPAAERQVLARVFERNYVPMMDGFAGRTPIEERRGFGWHGQAYSACPWPTLESPRANAPATAGSSLPMPPVSHTPRLPDCRNTQQGGMGKRMLACPWRTQVNPTGKPFAVAIGLQQRDKISPGASETQPPDPGDQICIRPEQGPRASSHGRQPVGLGRRNSFLFCLTSPATAGDVRQMGESARCLDPRARARGYAPAPRWGDKMTHRVTQTVLEFPHQLALLEGRP